jgi:hypothetical protein
MHYTVPPCGLWIIQDFDWEKSLGDHEIGSPFAVVEIRLGLPPHAGFYGVVKNLGIGGTA